MTKASATVTYGNIISHMAVHIALHVTVLNNIDLSATDVLSAYITARCHEKLGKLLGESFLIIVAGEAIIVKKLYGLKSSDATSRAHLVEFLCKMGQGLCPSDP